MRCLSVTFVIIKCFLVRFMVMCIGEEQKIHEYDTAQSSLFFRRLKAITVYGGC